MDHQDVSNSRDWLIANKKRIIMAMDDTVVVADDGQACPDVGAWAETKHNLVSYYARLFSSGMKNKWDRRIYIELYAGAGHARIRDTSKIIMGSPLRALLLPDPFDRYVFCEKDPDLIGALEFRAKKIAPKADVVFIVGDCNDRVPDLLAAMPTHSTLSLCFVDPCDIGIKFKTLRSLSERYVDFLVLLALYMDANRAQAHYVSLKSTKVAEFLDLPAWRDEWTTAESEGVPFPRFLAESFSRRMEALRYLPQPFYKMKQVILPEKNWPLYRLALFSRKHVAYQFWDQVLKYSTDQTTFWS